DLVSKCRAEGGKTIKGADAFVLYDTFGFPIDLTELIAKENNLEVDLPGFEAELKKQKERSRNADAKKEGDWVYVSAPEEESVFTGYDNTCENNVKILRYREVKTKGKDLFHIVLSKTPFYAESGGQVGDSGYIQSQAGEKIAIINTVKENGLSIHVSEKLPSDVEGVFTAQIDEEKRLSTTANHSATHLLDYALRKILGTHIEQKGSFVSPQVLRFDFSHFEKVQPDKLREVEKLVNSLIRKDIRKEEMRDMPIEEAKKLGAIALFGEKYGDKVRVIKFGDSVEFCGGTHIPSTGMIGYFKIMSESAIAAGIRRIEATTGKNAENLIYAAEDMMISLRELFKNSPNVIDSAKKLMMENETFRKQAEEMMKERAVAIKDSAKQNKVSVSGIDFIRLKGEFPMELMKTVAFMLRSECSNTVFAAGITDSAKPGLVLMYTDDLVAKGMNAGKDIRPAAKFINGGGGGQPFFASAGGKNVEGIDAALDSIKESLSK
ncbi:MAG: alanine--tRNA ligase, partial [Bacteroidales bacterium]|nr:alanine--tRNA ligase [Bacteroidales bacterium]